MLDPNLKKLLAAEIKRQEETLNLIPSENFASPEVRSLVGSPLMNKYSEGYPGKRYYPGNRYYDEIEELAKTYALRAFGLDPGMWAANAQPYSGSPANLAIYAALMEPGETLMGMALSAGGHLTHGHKVNFSGRFYRSVQYGVDPKTGLLDYDEIARLATREKPRVIVSGLTAYPRAIDFKKFGDIAKMVDAYHVADISHIAGLVLVGVHPSSFPHCDAVMMTTHKTLAGPRGAIIISRKSPLIRHSSPAVGGVNSSGNLTGQTTKPMTIADAIDRAVFPGGQGGPHNNTTAAIAQMFYEVMQPPFKKYAAQIVKNARALAEELKRLGAKLITGGTDNHLMLMDVTPWNLMGMDAEKLLEENGIIANRNSIPGDASPFKPSGIRMGTPSLTRRGMQEGEMKTIAALIVSLLVHKKPIAADVKKLCKKFSAKKYLKG